MMVDFSSYLPNVTPMSASDFEKMPWKGVLKHIGPVADATPLQVALMGKTNCGLYMIYLGCLELCMKRTAHVLEQRWNPMLAEQIFVYQFDWRYPKLFGITIEDVDNPGDRVTAVRRSLLYFFFLIVKKAATFFSPRRPVSEISFMINLTRHLCGSDNREVVDHWVQGMIDRMSEIAPFAGDNDPSIYDYADRTLWEAATLQTHGTPLPPEVLDLSLDLSKADLRSMANAWLNKIDPSANPLLQPPDVLLAKGFHGTPYRVGV